jgi:hypothetical protein
LPPLETPPGTPPETSPERQAALPGFDKI